MTLTAYPIRVVHLEVPHHQNVVEMHGFVFQDISTVKTA
jgi:hypothetical protein